MMVRGLAWFALGLWCVPAAAVHHPAAGTAACSIKPPAPYFHLTWKEEITEAARRLAVGDTTGDGKPRLILLADRRAGETASLIIKKWNGSQFVTEFTGNVEAPADKLAVGRFAGQDKPAVIVTADALWYWNGSTYARSAAHKPIAIFGAARMHSGQERLIVSESETKFVSYAVNPAQGDEWLTDRTEAPTATMVDWESMRATSDFFHKMRIPAVLGNGGLITIWDATKSETPYLFYCRNAAQDDPVSSADRPANSLIAFRDATDAVGNELWKTAPLNGMATDLALEDARTAGRRGLLILSSAAAAGKSRTLYFYAIE